MKALYELKEKLCAELDEIAEKQDMSAGDLEAVHKLTDTIKNIDKIMLLEEDGYSRDGGYGMGHGGRYDNDGNSYARRGGTYYVRGHYSRNDGRGYSRDGGSHYMIEELETLMKHADGEQREVIRRALDELRK